MLRNLLIGSAVVCLLPSCASTFTDRSKLDATVAHRIEGDRLVVTASVTNRSDGSVTFVHHPDFFSISVFAADRNKAEHVGDVMLISYVRATEEDLEVVRPGEAAVFKQSFEFRKKPGGVIEVDDGPRSIGDTRSYMRIWDDELSVRFRYGKYPDYLPDRAWALGKNYVMVDIGAQQTFRWR